MSDMVAEGFAKAGKPGSGATQQHASVPGPSNQAPQGGAEPGSQTPQHNRSGELPQHLAQSQIVAGNSHIGGVLNSTNAVDVGMKGAVFSDKFQDSKSVRAFLDTHLAGSVSGQLNAPASSWSTKSFQALFMAAWAHHPTEKGSYMIDLSGLPPGQLDQIKKAHEEHCTSRPSSHLSGKGRSASKDFEFLKGYKELLVQMEHIDGKPYLFLKTEGHTTGLSGIVGHTKSYLHKVKTGEGKTASPYLNAMATAAPGLVEPRAAENYGKDYGKLLKSLDLKGKSVTARTVTEALFTATGYQPAGAAGAGGFAKNATNEQLGAALKQYCDAVQGGGADGSNLRGPGNMVTDAAIGDLRKVAQSLIDDGATQHSRVHREIIVSPSSLDQSMNRLER
ncbi:hypothetical protein [Caldimonas brevitalea]|uniref:Uncharacterized protein n=1 Tax=Caldimonas brevitalea TaxID=413882 RepID=A0A0G3BDC9_9BURK|nr:hypothetical protein [Caldimonas brevitalea]AKJ27292.1 hypothetical protein AAW51_0601 [Caldimonas brevitalea]